MAAAAESQEKLSSDVRAARPNANMQASGTELLSPVIRHQPAQTAHTQLLGRAWLLTLLVHTWSYTPLPSKRKQLQAQIHNQNQT
jgi:hypothetical protein